MDSAKKTGRTYGFLWAREEKKHSSPENWHFNMMQEVVSEPIIRGSLGIDAGSGCGYDTFLMASHNPDVRIVSIDLSDGVYATKKLVSGLSNVSLLKCSLMEMPLRNEVFDFAYSFGVLHHTSHPDRALKEIARILKKGSPVFLYLYEDHSDNPVKYAAVKVVKFIRLATIKAHRKILYAICWLLSPLVFCVFTVPAKILRRFKVTKDTADTIPFNFGSHIFSLQDDLYDRLGAPIEFRFNRQAISEMLDKCGFSNIEFRKFKDSAGWVAWGYRQ